MIKRPCQLVARSAAIILVLASTLGSPLASFPAAAETAAAADGALGQRVAVIQQYFDTATRGDADGALAMFADSAVFIGARADGNCSQQTPCSDRAGISQALQANVAMHPCFTVRQLEVVGAIVSGRLEIRADAYPGLGIERTLLSFIAVVPQDKISFLTMLLDVTDPQTTTYVAVTSGRQAPTPLATPRTPCADVS